MISLIGNFCVYAALLSSAVGILFFWKNNFRRGKQAVYLNFWLLTLASGLMMFALLANDFSVSYVAQVGAVETPRFFAAISLWSSLEGSILFWGWVLSIYSALCMLRSEKSQNFCWVGIVLLAIGIFFYLVLAVPANPFGHLDPAPANGPGPNPLLQNHWLMGIHPPMLYLGYVGWSVPFAFAIAALIRKDFSDKWVARTRRWSLAAWGFLTAAIILGGWWSYAVLGWGGYWAWDPVENASFMPWLTGTAFLHSVMVQEKRGMLKVWNLSLVIITFLLTLLGTFLTRSGILQSVHSFTESHMGFYFLGAIAAALLVSTALLANNAKKLRSTGRLDHPLSRETTFLVNNLLLVCFCFVVFLGTLYPLVAEAVRGVKVTVGEPFFNQMSAPFALGLLLLMALGTATPWKRGSFRKLWKRLRLPLLAAMAAVIASFLAGIRKPLVLSVIFLAVFAFADMALEMGTGLLKKQPIFHAHPRRYGGFIVHIGLLMIAVAITLSGSYQKELQQTLNAGEKMTFGNYRIEFLKMMGEEKPHRFEVFAVTNIYDGDRLKGHLLPKMNYYPRQREPVGTPAVRSTLTHDLYLTLVAFDHIGKSATIKAIHTPAVSWIWGGGAVMIFGVLVAGGFFGQAPNLPAGRVAKKEAA